MANEPKNDFTLEEILAEQRVKKEKTSTGEPLPSSQKPSAAKQVSSAEPVNSGSRPEGGPPVKPAKGNPQAIGKQPLQKPMAPKPANPQQAFLSSQKANEQEEVGATEDLNLYATGNIKAADLQTGTSKKKKKGLFGWFGKRDKKKKVPDFDESDDMFYGLQLKPIDEYRKGFNTTGEFGVPQDTYADLFDESKKAIDDDVAESFRRLQQERRHRVEQAMQTSGLNENEVADELGIIAPMPVTSFAADPYAKQHGVKIEGKMSDTGDIPIFQKAQLNSVQNDEQTMQIKLNVLNDTIELESLRNKPPVSDESIDKILTAAPKVPESDTDLFSDSSTQNEPIQEQVYQERVPVQPQAPANIPPRRPVQKPAQEQVYQERTPIQPQVSTNIPNAKTLKAMQEIGDIENGKVFSKQYNNTQEIVDEVLPQTPANTPPKEMQKPVQRQVYQERKPVQPQVPTDIPPRRQVQKPVQKQVYQERTPVQPQVSTDVPPRRQAQKPIQEQVVYQEKITQRTVPAQTSRTESPVSKTAIHKDSTAVTQKSVPPATPNVTVPEVKSPFEYREKGVPMHVLNTDLSQILDFSTPAESNARSFVNKTARALQSIKQGGEERKPEKKQTSAVNAKSQTSLEEPESIDDYTNPDDAHSITSELKADMHDLTLRVLITGASTLILILVNLVFGRNLSADAPSSSILYVTLTLLFLAAAAVGCFRTILNGLKSLFSFNANSDSAIAVATVGVILQTVLGLFFQEALADGTLHLYAVVLTGALCINAAGKLTMIRRIHSNFRFVTSREQKYAVQLFDDHNTALKMTKNVVADKPVVAYQAKTGFLRRFLEISYRPDPSEISSQMLAPIGLIASLVLCIISMLITRSVPMAVNSLGASLIVSISIGNMLSVNLPMSRLSKLARRAGSMVSGYEAVRLAGDVNAVLMDANDLFPRGTVILDGIKTYTSRDRVEETIMGASALMKKIEGPLSGVFEQVITEKEDYLPDVSQYVYEDEFGIVGQVDDKTIYIGGRGLLIKHKIEPPPREDEAPYSANNNQVIYLAENQTVIAMLVLSYTADRRRRNELQRMEDNGISVVIRTTDPNVTPQFISRLFGIDQHSVAVLSDSLGNIYHDLVSKEKPRSDATIATKGRVESLMTVLAACVGSKRDVNFIVALQNIGVVLGFLLVAFLSCFGAIGKLSVSSLFIFELVWLLIVLVLPRMRKP